MYHSTGRSSRGSNTSKNRNDRIAFRRAARKVSDRQALRGRSPIRRNSARTRRLSEGARPRQAQTARAWTQCGARLPAQLRRSRSDLRRAAQRNLALKLPQVVPRRSDLRYRRHARVFQSLLIEQVRRKGCGEGLVLTDHTQVREQFAQPSVIICRSSDMSPSLATRCRFCKIVLTLRQAFG